MFLPAFFLKWHRQLLLVIALLVLFSISAQKVFAITPPEIRNQGDLVITQNMHGMDLKGREFVKADLKGVDLGEADLRGAVFNNSQLQGASFRGADMEDVVAFASVFDEADLRDANLANALLMESTFSETLIEGADFTNAVMNKVEAKQLCTRAEGTNPLSNINTSESLDC